MKSSNNNVSNRRETQCPEKVQNKKSFRKVIKSLQVSWSKKDFWVKEGRGEASGLRSVKKLMCSLRKPVSRALVKAIYTSVKCCTRKNVSSSSSGLIWSYLNMIERRQSWANHTQPFIHWPSPLLQKKHSRYFEHVWLCIISPISAFQLGLGSWGHQWG